MKLFQNLKYVDNLVEGKHQKSHLLIPSRLRCICLAQCLILYELVSISGRAGTAAMWVWGEESVGFSNRPPCVTQHTRHKAVEQGEKGWQGESITHFLPLMPLIHIFSGHLPKLWGSTSFLPISQGHAFMGTSN